MTLIEADGAETGGLASAWAGLGREARQNTPDDLEVEYNDLFIGLGRGELVPYASWHRTGFIMDQPLAALRADLRRLGIERSEHVSEPEDHIAALCETMAILVGGSEYDAATERTFFSDHLAPWAGAFFSQLEDAKTARFYRAVGRLGVEFIELEKECLAMSMST